MPQYHSIPNIFERGMGKAFPDHMKAILFDFDGTLADTISAIRSGVNLTMRALGYPESTHEDVLDHINFGARQLIRLSMPMALQSNEALVEEALALYNEMYEKTYMETDRTYEGIPEVLTKLTERGYRIAVLSNKQDSFIVRLCEALLPHGSYLHARGQRVGAPAKPDPTVPLEVAALLGAAPSECAFVGDSNVDMETAKNAGMRAVGVSWGYRSREVLLAAGADTVIESVPDLLLAFR